MHLVYVDESGDPGAHHSPTATYFLSSLRIPADRWAEAQNRLVSFRQRMRDQLGLKLAAEIHAVEFLGGAKMFLGLEARQRLRVALWLIRELRQIPEIRCLTVGCHKHAHAEPMKACWRQLAHSLESSTPGQMIMLADMGEEAAIRQAIAQFRAETPRQTTLIEDPFHRDSRHSYFLQATDLLAYLHRQRHHPNALFRDKQPEEIFEVLDELGPEVFWLK
jgi:hypothetical protein